MIALSSGYQIHIKNFDSFARETAELYVKIYSWYRMPVSVHTILFHGAAVAKSILLPISMMSEEAQEASNKIYRRVRERHTRKSSRLNTTEDLIHMMLQQSDPVISRARGLPKSKMNELPEDVLPLLIVDSMIDDDQ
ncbi:unnamed protein product [Macrosiphum euphorbiae]|uniref:Uncharacterized protein n=1 Tax=Macrosiphum euphorbiae TaxID=13131 RepID=A0AAV0WG83_9HEMI|nr:unnamed protein product [Macrosiphum euphorbiae]